MVPFMAGRVIGEDGGDIRLVFEKCDRVLMVGVQGIHQYKTHWSSIHRQIHPQDV